MQIDNIIANPPYGKIGVDLTNHIMNQVPHKDISILGTNAMLSKHNDKLALEYAYIEGYTLSPVTKCKWVRQIILLGNKGSCNVIPRKYYRSSTPEQPNEIRNDFGSTSAGQMRKTFDSVQTRNRKTSLMLSVSDEDFEYLKEHWNSMSYVERFWWLHDHGLYKRYIKE